VTTYRPTIADARARANNIQLAAAVVLLVMTAYMAVGTFGYVAWVLRSHG